jgi:putative protease
MSARPDRPELLAPAGDRDCAVAAIENGADAIYFGLQTHNARARAANFHLDDLPGLMALLRARGVRGYVTLNTLVFPAELPGVETLIRRVAEAGVDALIVQDLGLCRLARAITPDLELHASTQMSVTSAEGVALARELGCSRVILARELSLDEIAKVRGEAALPVEVFVHGALCVAYSGQCLTSEALGGRSANRGECAQACRMPYEIVCDGELVELGDVQYLLSPQDLAAFDLVPRLVELGVASLKIEGRLKTPEYVANITRSYRRAIDAALAGRPTEFARAEVHDMEMSFSRGFSHGFLDGNDHKALVRGDYAKKRGVFLGRVIEVRGDRVRLDLEAPLKPGDGVVFDADPGSDAPEQGGRVYEVARPARRGAPAASEPHGLPDGPAEIAFGRRDLDARRLVPGQRLWKTDDPELTRRLRASFSGPARRRVGLDVHAVAVAGEPLALEATTATGLVARVASDQPLAAATNRPATIEEIRPQVDRLGDTIYRLDRLTATIEGGPLVPRSLLNALRRDLVARLDALAAVPPPRRLAPEPVLPALRASIVDQQPSPTGPPALSALCRDLAQAEAALASGVAAIYLDFQHIKEYAGAVATLRGLGPGPEILLATPRIEKPGEAPIFRFLARAGADGLLVRNAGGLAFCAANGVPFVADFSLNAANELTVALLKSRGARRVAASYDLSFDQLDDLARAVPPGWLEAVVHQHMPMFHMEHCVFCAFLSPGHDKTDCGRPCDVHDVRLRDRVGMEHRLTADVGCRNTLFNAVPQTAAEYLPRLADLGVRHLRVEFLDDDPATVARTLGLYADALAGRRDARTLWRDLKATNRYGVTRGQLAVIG